MQKGILLEVEGRTGVVLTPKGEFKRVPLPQGAREVGEEIAFQEAGSWRWGWLAAAAAVLLLVFTPLGYQQWQLAQPVALLMIDINPSIQLTLNSREQVIDALGLNADGEAVLEGITWRRRSVGEVTRAVAAEAVAAGKLDPAADGSTVVVAVAPVKGDALPSEFSQAVVAQSRSALEAEVSTQAESRGVPVRTEVAVVAATADEVEQAREQDLTLPRLIILEELRADHPEVTADTIRELPPAQILKELGISPSEIFSRAEERHNRSDDSPASAPLDADDGDDDDDDDRPGKSNNGNGNGNNGQGNNGNGNNKGATDDDGDEDIDDEKPGNGNGQNNANGNSPADDDDKPGKGLGRDKNNGKGNGKGNSGVDGDDDADGEDDDPDVYGRDDHPGDDDDERGTNSANNPGQGSEPPGQGSSGVTTPGDDEDDASGQGQGNPGKGNGNAGNGNPGKGNPGKGNGKGNSGVDGDDDDDRDDDAQDEDDERDDNADDDRDDTDADEDDETDGQGKGRGNNGKGNDGSNPGRGNGNARKLEGI